MKELSSGGAEVAHPQKGRQLWFVCFGRESTFSMDRFYFLSEINEIMKCKHGGGVVDSLKDREMKQPTLKLSFLITWT